MINDPIVTEVRKVRQKIFNTYGSLRAYHEAIIEKQKEHQNLLITLSAKRIDPNKNLHWSVKSRAR